MNLVIIIILFSSYFYREEVNINFRGKPDGTFVVRNSSSGVHGNYTLTVR